MPFARPKSAISSLTTHRLGVHSCAVAKVALLVVERIMAAQEPSMARVRAAASDETRRAHHKLSSSLKTRTVPLWRVRAQTLQLNLRILQAQPRR